MNLGRGVAPAVSLDIRGNLAVEGEKPSVTQSLLVERRFSPNPQECECEYRGGGRILGSVLF